MGGMDTVIQGTLLTNLPISISWNQVLLMIMVQKWTERAGHLPLLPQCFQPWWNSVYPNLFLFHWDTSERTLIQSKNNSKYKLDIPHTITPRSIWHPKLSRNWFQSYQNCHINIYKNRFSLEKKNPEMKKLVTTFHESQLHDCRS